MSDQALRVGLVGLSSRSQADNAPGFWARAAHLPAIQASPHYTLTALSNSSVEAAQAAVKLYKLNPDHVATYGDPLSLARDPNVDVVVCSVNVEHHYAIVKPALEASKMVICEWPLASNAAQMRELADLARDKAVRTALGLQGRFSDLVRTIKRLVGDGPENTIGRLLSTSMLVHGVMLESSVPEGLEYFCRRESGGNMLTIRTIHLLDMLSSALGSPTHIGAHASTRRPTLPIAGSDDPSREIPVDTPDHISLQGRVSGAPFSYLFRTGRPFGDEPVFDWRVYGDRGEIRVTSHGTGVQMDHDVKVEVFEFDTGVVKTVDPKTETAEVQGAAKNTARMYEAFTKGTEEVVDFQEAMNWVDLVEEVYRALDSDGLNA